MASIPQESSTSIIQTEFIVDSLLPTREIHLIAGGSGAGKTTIACQIAQELIAGGDFFGFPINSPQKVAYLSFDRTLKGLRLTFERTLGTTAIPFPYYSVIASKEFRKALPIDRCAEKRVRRLLELHPDTNVIILDGIGMAFSGDSGSLSQVASFVHALITLMLDWPYPLTIFALHLMPKVKKGQEYSDARQRLHGSVAWAATAETCILIEREDDAKVENPHRIITVCPRNLPERSFTYAFNEDGLLLPAAGLTSTQDRYLTFVAEISKLSAQTDLTSEILCRLGENIGIPERTCQRYISDMVNDAVLIRVKRGTYRLREKAPN